MSLSNRLKARLLCRWGHHGPLVWVARVTDVQIDWARWYSVSGVHCRGRCENCWKVLTQVGDITSWTPMEKMVPNQCGRCHLVHGRCHLVHGTINCP